MELEPNLLDWNVNELERQLELEGMKRTQVYYENWVKKIGSKHMEFQKLWENVMISSTSEAQCESIGSLFVIHFCNLNNEKNINLKIRKSSLIWRLPNRIVQILNRYI